MFEVHQPDEVGGSHTGKSISIASPSAQRVPWTVLLSTRDQQAFSGKGQALWATSGSVFLFFNNVLQMQKPILSL